MDAEEMPAVDTGEMPTVTEEETPVILVENARKSFRDQMVLKDVSLVCQSGKIYGIVGRNGSGKTVLFKCICGLLFPDSGRILVRGKEMKKEINMIRRAGVIIEEPAFLSNYSGLKNLEYLYRIQNKKDTQHLKQVLETVGLDPGMKKTVKHYSMGMRQRLAIAQAIMEDPDILILDEPMNGLDNQGVADMRDLFKKKKEEGKTILLASHNKEDIDILCDHVYEMDLGNLTQIR